MIVHDFWIQTDDFGHTKQHIIPLRHEREHLGDIFYPYKVLCTLSRALATRVTCWLIEPGIGRLAWDLLHPPLLRSAPAHRFNKIKTIDLKGFAMKSRNSRVCHALLQLRTWFAATNIR